MGNEKFGGPWHPVGAPLPYRWAGTGSPSAAEGAETTGKLAGIVDCRKPIVIGMDVSGSAASFRPPPRDRFLQHRSPQTGFESTLAAWLRESQVGVVSSAPKLGADTCAGVVRECWQVSLLDRGQPSWELSQPPEWTFSPHRSVILGCRSKTFRTYPHS